MVAPLIALLAGATWLGGNQAYGDYRAKKRRSILDENVNEAMGLAQQEVIPEGGVSPDNYVANEMLRNYQTPQGQSDLYGGLLGGGYSRQQALDRIGLLNPQQQQEQLGIKDMFGMTQDLSKQRTNLLKPYMEQSGQAQKTITALEQGTGAGDLAAVISFNKALDPASVVRESESAKVSGVAGPIERLRGLLSNVQGEGELTPYTRRQLATLVGEIQANEAAYANNIVQDFENRASRYQIDPMDIRGGQLGYTAEGAPRERFSSMTIPKSLSLPAIGTIDAGFQYMGGDPGDPTSWTKI